MISYNSPEYFWLLLPLLGVLVLSFFFRKKQAATLKFSNILAMKKLDRGVRPKLLWLPWILKFVGLAFVILALARPQKSDTRVKKNVEGIDIMIVLDVSDSMLIEDMKPNNRLEAAKETIHGFIEKRTSDRIGLVVFAGEAFTLVPLTLDYQLIKERLQEIQTAQTARIKDGTALGVALATGAGRLKDSSAKSRVIIFMTDGENNSGTIDPETGLEIAKGFGLKIYSIGIGRDGPTRIPTFQRDVFGNRVKSYQPFESTVNEEYLDRVAKDTGGKFFRASREDSLQGVFAAIDELEKTKIDVNKYTRYTELFPPYLWTGVALYLLAWFLGLTWLRRAP